MHYHSEKTITTIQSSMSKHLAIFVRKNLEHVETSGRARFRDWQPVMTRWGEGKGCKRKQHKRHTMGEREMEFIGT